MDDLEGTDELDLAEVEREICRLPDVSIARLVAEPSGRVSEVHVVAHPGKHPKQIARDVQSIALASFGLELDRRIISVVQLGGEAFDAESAAVGIRPSVVAITAEASGLRSLVRVTLAHDDEESVGFAEGSVATSARHRLVATRDGRRAPPARARGRVHRRRPRADPAGRPARRRRRHRRVRAAPGRAARVGLGDRSPAAGSRRRRTRRCSTRPTAGSRTSDLA